MTIIIRENTVISANMLLTEDIQVAAGATLTILPGITVNLNGHEILVAGTLHFAGNADHFAVIGNGEISTEDTNGQITGNYARMVNTYVDDFFSNGAIKLTHSAFENSTIDILENSDISESLFWNTTVNVSGTVTGRIDESTFINSPIKVMAWTGPFSGSFTMSEVNLLGTSEVIRLDPFFGGKDFRHNVFLDNVYVKDTLPAQIDSRVFDSNDDIRVNTDIKPSSFVNVPFVNDDRGFVVGQYVVDAQTLLKAGQVYGTGNDSIANTQYSEYVEGGAGIDTAVYHGKAADYDISAYSNGYGLIVADNLSEADMYHDVERLKFDDKSIALDINGKAGEAYRIYRAAFDRTPDKDGLGFWINAMDKGQSLVNVAQGFTQSNEFKLMYGSAPSNRELVEKFYLNVLDRQSDKAGIDFWVGHLDAGNTTVAEVLAGFSESNENRAAVIGQIINGIEFTPYGG